MSEATQTQTQTLEQTLNKTDFGHIVYENRKTFFAALVAVLVVVTGFLFWKQAQTSAANDHSVKVFEFQNGIWTDVKSGKADVATLIKTFEGLDQKVRTSPVMVPLALEIGKFLFEKGQLAEASTILMKAAEGQQHPVTTFFIGMQRAVVLEKLGKLDEAIAVLEPLAQNKEALMPARLSFELGRLYLSKGEKGKAQTQFDYILSTYPNDDQAKLAKLYLAKIAQ